MLGVDAYVSAMFQINTRTCIGARAFQEGSLFQEGFLNFLSSLCKRIDGVLSVIGSPKTLARQKPLPAVHMRHG